MKESLSKVDIISQYFNFREILKKFETLHKDEFYKICYENLKALIEINNELYDGGNFHITENIRLLTQVIKKSWDLKFPLNPNSKLTKDDLYSNDEEVKRRVLIIIYSLGYPIDIPVSNIMTSDESQLLEYFTKKSLRKSSKISKEKFNEEKKMLKVLIYSLSENMKIKDRVLSRIFSIDKNTVKNWIEEVAEWPDRKKDDILNGMQTGKRRSRRDIYDVGLSEQYKDDKSYKKASGSSYNPPK